MCNSKDTGPLCCFYNRSVASQPCAVCLFLSFHFWPCGWYHSRLGGGINSFETMQSALLLLWKSLFASQIFGKCFLHSFCEMNAKNLQKCTIKEGQSLQLQQVTANFPTLPLSHPKSALYHLHRHPVVLSHSDMTFQVLKVFKLKQHFTCSLVNDVAAKSGKHSAFHLS